MSQANDSGNRLYFHLCVMAKHVSFFVLIFTFWSRVVVILSRVKPTTALFLRGKSPARKKGLNNLTLCLQKFHLLSYLLLFVSLKTALHISSGLWLAFHLCHFCGGKRKMTAEIDILISICQEWNLWMSTHSNRTGRTWDRHTRVKWRKRNWKKSLVIHTEVELYFTQFSWASCFCLKLVHSKM